MIRCKLSTILGERRMKITELHNRTGVTKVTILSLYHEKAKGVTFAVIDKICGELGIQPGDLLIRVPNAEQRTITYEVVEEG